RMIYTRVSRGSPEDEADRAVLEQLDGRRDVAAIAGAAGLTQFDVARALHRLVRAGLARAMAPDKVRIIELFSWLAEAIHVKLMMVGLCAGALILGWEYKQMS